MKKTYILTILSACLAVLAIFGLQRSVFDKQDEKHVTVGIIYVGDESTAYTMNFVKAQNAIENEYGDRVEIISKYNIPEGSEEHAILELVDAGCDIIFGTSYGYGEMMKQYAKQYPMIEFCQATCSNANDDEVLVNYHTFMGAIYEGRYVSGVVAGMKLKELIEQGKLTIDQAKVGYVGAYPYAEVISGYTAFFLGVREAVPEATMVVRYTNTWDDYMLEKKCAQELIEEGCVILSQHSDTTGPAVACEETGSETEVYLASYNQSMADVAPTTYLTGCKINWVPYMTAAVGAVLDNKSIEARVKGNVNGQDIGAGFDEGWVEMLELNEVVAAKGTSEKIAELQNEFKKGSVHVFQGDYLGVNPNDTSDTYDLNKEYVENRNCSAPTFDYILQDVITIEE